MASGSFVGGHRSEESTAKKEGRKKRKKDIRQVDSLQIRCTLAGVESRNVS